MNRAFRYILFGLFVILIVMQFIRPDRSIPEYDQGQDFMTLMSPPEDVKTILKNACYDCHSYHTTYPWYDQIAPVSYWLSGHVNHGREELNFSVWGTYSDKKSDHKLEECVEKVDNKSMPLKSYTWAHKKARLSSEQRALINSYFNSLRE